MPKQEPWNWMFHQACAMIERAEREHRRFFSLGPREEAPWEPPADVFETEEEVVVLVALPGVDSEAIDVQLEGATVRVIAQRSVPDRCRAATVHRFEIPHGRFVRQIALPGRSFELMGRDFAQGCLTLSLRKISK